LRIAMLTNMSAHKVTISGSYRKHLGRILAAKRQFEALGLVVLRPEAETILESEGALVRLEGDSDDLGAIQEAQLRAISASDLVYVVNPGGYIGTSATLEVGWARRAGITVVSAEPAFEEVVATVIQGVGSPEESLAFLGEGQ
jgi:hypothetical protein